MRPTTSPTPPTRTAVEQRRRRPRTLAALAAAVLLATACGGGDPAEEPAEPTASPTTDATADATEEPTATEAAGDVTVTLLTHDSFNVSDEVLAAFEERSGIDVEILPGGDAGSMVNQAILTAGDPQGDVLFGVDNTFLSRALEADLFVPYESPGLEAVDERYILDDEHRVTPIDVGDVCLNYDRDVIADEEAPGSLEELVPVADQLVVMNPATSSPGLAFLLATVETFGEDGYLDFWEQVADEVTVTEGWEDGYYGQFSGGSGEGDNPLVVSYASSPPAEVFFADPQPDEAPTGVVEASCFRQIEFAGILRGTEHEAEAQQVVDWLLSREFQEDIPLNMFVFPVNRDATLPDVFVEHALLPEDPIQMDFREIGENREAWIEAWTQTVLR